jgi:hypothetical protein
LQVAMMAFETALTKEASVTTVSTGILLKWVMAMPMLVRIVLVWCLCFDVRVPGADAVADAGDADIDMDGAGMDDDGGDDGTGVQRCVYVLWVPLW